jgi:hypothetical protein
MSGLGGGGGLKGIAARTINWLLRLLVVQH